MSAFSNLLHSFRENAKSEREKGNSFESLVKLYLQKEPFYEDLYTEVWLWEEWRQYCKKQGHTDPGTDTGIDLVAKTRASEEYHAIQAKFFDKDSKIYKRQLDSFFTASGKKPFSHRLIVLTTDKLSVHLDTAFQDQQIPVSQITLSDLENSKIDWSSYLFKKQEVKLQNKKEPFDYQKAAISNVIQGFKTADRGKLIMACGTGKTLTVLRLAEQMVGKGGRLLFLVPSLNLLSQSLTEWTQEANIPLHSYAVCSDSEVGKKRNIKDDFQMLVHELQYPATTNAKSLGRGFALKDNGDHLNVVFSTYHSIAVISEAQRKYNLPEFDLVICDEAHRTTGATFEGEDESAFVRIHDTDFIHAKKRLYMTATPRVYGTMAKATAERDSIVLYSMDNEEHFGRTLHTLTFSEAVNNLNILCDYKVIVLTISEDHISRNLQRLLADENNSINVNDAAKIVGCWRALSKMDSHDDLAFDPDPMKRAVAFAQVIEISKGARTHKVSSKNIARMFAEVVNEYRKELLKENPKQPDDISSLLCEVEHVDGSMNAQEKNAKLEWLKAPVEESTCRILSNVRCLSEGVDVPALDAVLFLTPRNSQVDVVQSVGRVMRKPKDGSKKLGYVILPVVIPSGVSPEEALNDNKTYRVVWEVLQALRSHDDRFDAMINKMDLIGQDKSKMEVIAITDKVTPKSKKTSKAAAASKKTNILGKQNKRNAGQDDPTQLSLQYEFGEIERAIMAKVVQKCGNRLYWDEWAQDIGRIAQTHITRITALLDKPENVNEIQAFETFLNELKDDLNDSISRQEAIEMLAQHLITKPVFDALFEGYSFTQNNPVSKAMQKVLDVLEDHHLEKESDTLHLFYESVKMRASGITEVRAKQRIIIELYEKFFRNAFPKMTERLGIVYTPVEVVDFIIHSVNEILEEEFEQDLGSRHVHIIDPFTGTGTFITRLLQSGLISKKELAYKYQNEIHANEIVLLAYYIAAINVEQVYHDIMGGDYVPFNGICLTDTFALHQDKNTFEQFLPVNSARLKRQRELDIRVIICNPPYSAGQTSANDNNANLEYPELDMRIRNTYAKHSTATNKNALYDSYIRAIRWASDRIGNSGVIGLVSNAGWVEANTADGVRKCLAEEFSSIYVFHLRGNQRTSGELSRMEGGKIFGSGSRAPIAITLLVKNLDVKELGKIVFHEIGDYLTREEKLVKIEEFKSIHGITAVDGWQMIIPDKHNDWIKQRDDSFSEYISLGDKKAKGGVVVFENYSRGISTARDAWCYNFSCRQLYSNMRKMIEFYNSEVARYIVACAGLDKAKYPIVNEFINTDSKKISWNRGLKNDLTRFVSHPFQDESIVSGVYRPFTKSGVYFNKSMNDMVYQMPRIFPDSTVENRVICVTGRGETVGFSALIVDAVPNLHTIASSQCFPLKLYEDNADDVKNEAYMGLFHEESEPRQEEKYTIRDGITDVALHHFQAAYPGEMISKEDLFYYIYGILYSEDYRSRYADNLSKELPRIPAVKTSEDFWAFSQAGRDLAKLHIGYESVESYPVGYKDGPLVLDKLSPKDLRVTQMKFAKGSGGQKWDKSTVIYNHKITMTNIPIEAYDYVVNGKPALEWVMERQSVTTHKESGIVNDANLWAIETMNDAAYPLKLFQRMITVSLETMKIVRSLPKL